jgi:hypothetical protein
MIKDSVKQTGLVDIVLSDEHGHIKEQFTVKNLVVQSGRSFIAHRMASAGNAVMSHMAIGTGSTAAQLADTTLETETARVALTSTTVSANTVQYIATFPAGTPATANAISEAGIFNNTSGGEMLCRTVFGVINKSTLDTLSITWTIVNN